MGSFKVKISIVAVWSVQSLYRFNRSRHISGIMEERIRSTTALVSRTNFAGCIRVVVGRCDNRILCLGFVVSAMPPTFGANSNDSASKTAHLQSSVPISYLCSDIREKKDPCEFVSSGVGIRFTLRAFLDRSIMGIDGFAWCTSVGRVIILRVLVWKPFCFSISG